jgi:hypothetical protein
MTKPKFISSVSVSESRGPHDYVNVFIRGQNVGTLVVGKGDAEPLRAVLMREPGEPPPPPARKGRGKPMRPSSPPPPHRRSESERPPAGDAR